MTSRSFVHCTSAVLCELLVCTPCQVSLTGDRVCRYGLPASTPVNILGPNNHTASGLESTMDIELILSVAPGVNSTFWLGPYNDTLHRAWVLHFLASLNNNTSPPLVNSISYGV